MNSDILATTLKGLHIFLSHCVCGLALCCVRFLDAGGVGSPPVQLQHRSQAHIHTNITECSSFFYNFPAIKTGVLLFCCCCWLVICLPDCLTACMLTYRTVHTFEILIYYKFRSLPSCGFESRPLCLSARLPVSFAGYRCLCVCVHARVHFFTYSMYTYIQTYICM